MKSVQKGIMPVKKSSSTVAKRIPAKRASTTSKSTNVVTSRPFPSVIDGLRKAWKMIPKVALPAIGATVLMYLSTFLVIGILGGGFFIANMGSFSELSKGSMNEAAMGTLFTSGGVVLALALLVVTIISTLYAAVQTKLYVSAYENQKPNIGQAISQSWSLILPLAIVGIISSFLSVGGMFLLVIPGLVIALLLSFVSFAVIVDGHRGVGALRESVRLVTQSFWPLVLRVIVVGLAVIILQTVVEEVFRSMSIVIMIVNLLQTLFLTAYGLVLYQEAKDAAADSQKPGITWMFVLAAIGIILGFASIGFILKTIKNSPEIGQYLRQAMNSDEMKFNGDDAWKNGQFQDELLQLEDQLPADVLNSPEYLETQRQIDQLLKEDSNAYQLEQGKNTLYAQ